MVTSSETAHTFLIGAIGIVVPQLVQNWATLFLTIASFLWVIFQIVLKAIETYEKYKPKK